MSAPWYVEDFSRLLKEAETRAIFLTVTKTAPRYFRATSWLWFRRLG